MTNTGKGQHKEWTPEETERLQFAAWSADIGVWEVDLQNNTMIWDQRCRELFGISKDQEISYNDAIAYIHPDDRNAVNAAARAALAGENEGYYEMRHRTIGAIDGKLRWVHFRGRAFFDEQGRPVRFGGIAQDATIAQNMLKKTEQSLQDHETLFRRVTSSAPTGLWLSDELGSLTYLNETLVGWTGMRYEDLLGNGW